MQRSTWSMRALRAAALAAVVTGSGADPVAAKIPYFTVDITPTTPIAGEPILIVVRFWADPDHTSAAPVDWEPTMDDLVAIRADNGAADVSVLLELREPGRFEATVTLEAGDWTIIAFPDRTGWATAEVPSGYPDSIPIAVRSRTQELRVVAGSLVVVGLAIVALVCIPLLIGTARFARAITK